MIFWDYGFDTTKARDELGMDFRGYQETIIDLDNYIDFRRM